MRIPIKYLIAGLLIIGLAFVGLYLYTNYQRDQLIESVKEDFKIEKAKLKIERDSIIDLQKTKIIDLKDENERAKEKSKYWYDEAKKRNYNPNYNIDFITSHSIISKSNYQSGE